MKLFEQDWKQSDSSTALNKVKQVLMKAYDSDAEIVSIDDSYFLVPILKYTKAIEDALSKSTTIVAQVSVLAQKEAKYASLK